MCLFVFVNVSVCVAERERERERERMSVSGTKKSFLLGGRSEVKPLKNTINKEEKNVCSF